MYQRRSILRAVGMAGVSGLAGCSGSLFGGSRTEPVVSDSQVRMELVSTLTGAGIDDSALFGSEVALSADGETAIIGAPDQNASREGTAESKGAVHVFENADESWSQEQEFQPAGPPAMTMGGEVAVSGDGMTAFTQINGPGPEDGTTTLTEADDGGPGFVQVFTRSEGAWTRATTITPPAERDEERFGRALAVSNDGAVVLIGDSTTVIDGEDRFPSGGVDIYERSDDSWAYQETLAEGEEQLFGRDVAVSHDGTTAVVCGRKSAYVYQQTPESWIRQANLQPTIEGFATSVAVSDDGATAALTATNDNYDETGATYVFQRSEGVWTQESVLIPNAHNSDPRLNVEVEMSASGSTIAVGARLRQTRGDDIPGAVYIFDRTNGAWSYRGSVQGKQSGEAFGVSVALSATSETMLVGNATQRTDNGTTGAAFVYNSL